MRINSEILQNHFNNVLGHLYISPLSACNLACQVCYTHKNKARLTEGQIFNFIKRYQDLQVLKMITFCGGEVFILNYFSNLINNLIQQGIFIQIITNGTIDRLSEINNPNSVNLIVSLDGVELDHDRNRGKGNFKKTINFMHRAQDLGFHLEIFSIVTQQNYFKIDMFELLVKQEFGELAITYHPRKNLSYLKNHPYDNICNARQGFDFLNQIQLRQLAQTRNIFPPPKLGCYQISLMPDGKIYGCCEGIQPLGDLQTEITTLVKNLYINVKSSYETLPKTFGCCEKNFVCGQCYTSI